jgi:hypothetical protein
MQNGAASHMPSRHYLIAEVQYRLMAVILIPMFTDRELLAALSPGGSRERPIRVASASVVEVRTSALGCPLCGGEYRLDEHVRPEPGLRRVDVHCRHCSTPRSLWFRIVETELN